MKSHFKPFAILLLLVSAFLIVSFISPKNKTDKQPAAVNASPKIQAAILLDVSGSMDGLIEQAKARRVV